MVTHIFKITLISLILPLDTISSLSKKDLDGPGIERTLKIRQIMTHLYDSSADFEEVILICKQNGCFFEWDNDTKIIHKTTFFVVHQFWTILRFGKPLFLFLIAFVRLLAFIQNNYVIIFKNKRKFLVLWKIKFYDGGKITSHKYWFWTKKWLKLIFGLTKIWWSVLSIIIRVYSGSTRNG